MFTACRAQVNTNDASIPLKDPHAIPISIGNIVTEMNDSIMVVFQDKHDNYWFGGNGAGVYRYDGKTIVHFSTKDGLCGNRIWKIEEDKSGNLYFPSQQGCISKFDGQKFTTLSIVPKTDKDWKLEPDDLWFRSGQDSGVVYRYDGTTLYRLPFPKYKLAEDLIAKYPRAKYPTMNFNPYDVYTVYKDTKGNVWFGTGIIGVCRYDGTSINWISEEDVTELDDGPANGVRSIIEDTEGKFWFSNTKYRYSISESKKEGMGKEDSMDGSGFSYIREKSIGSLDGNPDGDLKEYMSAVVDDKGEIWIATYGAGVWHYNGKKITHYPILEGNTIVTLYSIYKDNHGHLWLGTHTAGPYRFNGKSFEKFRP